MKNVIFSLTLALAAYSIAALAQNPAPPASAEQARTVQYHSQDIVPIRAKVKYTTLIVVPSTEKIMEAATGDKDFWIVDVVGSFCFVHPAKPNISSNLNLITDKGNIYSFTLQDMTAQGGDPDLRSSFSPPTVRRSPLRPAPPSTCPLHSLRKHANSLRLFKAM